LQKVLSIVFIRKITKINLFYSISGMRSDWILTDEERMHKKQKIEENRRLRQMLYPDSSESDEVR